MTSSANRRFLLPFILTTGACLVLLAAPAQAHKIKIFAAVEGPAVSGYVYFPGGGRARDTAIEILDPNGNKIGETKTNDAGEFSFQPRYKCDHVLVCSTPDGHQAQWTVGADELPEELPPLHASQPGADPLPPPDATAAPGPPQSETPGASATPAEIEQAVADAVAKEIAPLRAQVTKLRQELERYRGQIRLHDVLGGIGYILGLAGLIAYLHTRRMRNPRAGHDMP
ncbi:MAG TPA: hypothetical protein HPP77_00115 [Candidatus Hydrogenedentes bacterium]|nr:hypothetical protein [Candidatus Hydrogenedentota bacterium]